MKKFLKQITRTIKKYRVPFSLLIVCLSITVAFYVLITAPKNFAFTEQLQYSAAPNAAVKHAFLSFGQLGLWDNTNGLGYPLIGHISSNFYPISFVGFFISDDLFSIRLQVFLHLLLAGLACFYLLSVLKLNNPSRILGSICFVINDYVYFAVYRGFLPETTNLVWMTLAVAFLWQAYFKKKNVYAVLCGIALAMHVIAMISYALYFTVIILPFLTLFYFFYQQLVHKESVQKTILFLLKNCVLISATFVGVSAIKLLPILQYSFYSTRSQYALYTVLVPGTWSLATGESLRNYVTGFLIPHGQVPLKYGFAIVFSFMTNIFFFLLLILSLTKKSKETIFFLILSFFVLWATMGNHALIDMYSIFYILFPGIKTLNHPERLFIITNLTLPVLVAIGFTTLSQKLKKYPYILGLFLVILILPATLYVRAQMLHYIHITPDHRTFHPDNIFLQKIERLVKNEKDIVHVGSTYYQDSKTVGSYSAVNGNFLLANPPLESFQLTYQHMPLFGNNLHPSDDFLQKKYKYLALMNIKYFATTNMYDDHAINYKSLIFTNQHNSTEDGSIYQIRNVNPFISITPYAILFIGKDTYHDFNALQVKSLVLSKSFVIQKFTIFSTDEPIAKIDLQAFDAVIIDDTVKISQEVVAYQRHNGMIFPIHFSTRTYTDLAERSDSLFYDKPAVYISSDQQQLFDAFLQQISQKNYSDNSDIKLLSLTPEKIILSVKTKKQTAMTIADTYFPNWVAKDGTKNIPVFISDGLLKGVIILQGTHTITLQFIPIFFYIGTIITGVSLIVLLIYFLKMRKL